MNRKVTIQDIADALGLSRNTVSKAINNSEGIAEPTRDRILQKAVEMGYKQFSYVSGAAAVFGKEHIIQNQGDISLFTTAYVSGSHFATTLLDKVHEEISQLGYTLTTHRVSEANIHALSLPGTFTAEKVKAIICVEMFDPAYCDMLCSLDIPLLFIDGPYRHGGRSVNADLLLMDNTSEIVSAIRTFADRGIRKIGFIGDYEHCQSFWERYVAFGLGLTACGLPFERKHIIHPKDKDLDALAEALDNIDDLPELFVCANDFVAIDAMHFLAQKDRTILSRVRFLGFDDSHESRLFYPTLSTVHIHSQAMSFSALHLLMSRIKEPSLEYRSVYVATDLVLRDSTEF